MGARRRSGADRPADARDRPDVPQQRGADLEREREELLHVTALVAVCIVFIAANTASMTVRERMREIAILKAMGFSRRAVFGMLVAEATLLATIAGATGAFASLGLSELVRHASGHWNPAMGPLASFIVTNAILVQGLFLAFFIGMLSGVVPSFGAARRGVVQTLREVF
ncbi:MAG: ABC transporter permease [Deltaproteobacteria bacterium]|nr:MAG: ABC transporter permease [Deltaproteobacteria bacterium]